MDLDIAGRGVLVTGGSGGIGAVVAQVFVQEGARVAIGARSQAGLDATADRIESATGTRPSTVIIDVTDETAIGSAVQKVVAEFGRLDVVVNAAVDVVGGAPGGASDMPAAALADSLNVKVLGALRVIQAALPPMRAQGFGRIIALGGGSARQVGAASAGIRNAGLAALAKNVANQVARDGITVNVIHPGGVLTDRTRPRVEQEQARGGGTFDEAEARLSSDIPLGRMVHPEDIAALAVFLASPAAEAITGQTIGVDGGSTRTIVY